MVYQLKSKIIHIKQNIKGHNDCKWYTFKQGDIVPDNLLNLVVNNGGELIIKQEPQQQKLPQIVEQKAENNDQLTVKKPVKKLDSERSLLKSIMSKINI